MSSWKDAGEGDHYMYRLVPPGQTPLGELTGDEDYLGVDSASWFINKQSGWFKDRTASGTLRITLASGAEDYHAALGTFELAHGARTAPIFDRPVLPDRRYRGGPITFAVTLTALNRDTAFASVLKSAAKASLNIVGGMVETAAGSGPHQVLTAAGTDLVRGIGDVLSNKADGRQPLFGSQGMEGTIHARDFQYSTMYLLFHRGTRVEPSKLKTAAHGAARGVLYENQPFEDGAWLLLRLRRARRYTGYRPWEDAVQKLRADIENLVGDFTTGVTAKADALRLLLPGGDAGSTYYDEFAALRRSIRDDGALTSRDGAARTRALAEAIVDARRRISADDPSGLAPSAPVSLADHDASPSYTAQGSTQSEQHDVAWTQNAWVQIARDPA